MRGRIPKPTALAALQGNPGHRSTASGQEPAPPAGVPEPPSWLDAVGKRKWFAVCGQMALVPGWLTKMDGDVLGLYCSAWSRFVEAEVGIPKLRRRVARAEKEDRGWILNEINTLVGQRKQAMRDLKAYGTEFGWSAASRTRIRVGQGGQGELPLCGEDSGRPETAFEKSQRLAGA